METFYKWSLLTLWRRLRILNLNFEQNLISPGRQYQYMNSPTGKSDEYQVLSLLRMTKLVLLARFPIMTLSVNKCQEKCQKCPRLTIKLVSLYSPWWEIRVLSGLLIFFLLKPDVIKVQYILSIIQCYYVTILLLNKPFFLSVWKTQYQMQ